MEEFYNLSIRLNASRNSNETIICWSSSGVPCSTPRPTDFRNDSFLEGVLAVPEEKEPKLYWALLLIILPLLAISGNILVILSVYREKSLQSVTNYFIVSLAVADMLVGGFVMPFAVYFLVNVDWELSEMICDFWIAIDVTLSTASILNLVAISIDRFMAVTRPIKYAKHKSNNRVMFTIAIVWIISITIGSPIVLGLNTSPQRTPELCIFYNSDFIIYSSLGSFYIPCVLMVILYYRIFKAIRERAKKPIGSSRDTHQKGTAKKDASKTTKGVTKTTLPSSGDVPTALVIENVHSLKSETIDRLHPSSKGSVAIVSSPDLDVRDEDDEEEEEEDDSQDEAVECKVIANISATRGVSRTTNGNPDSGYAASNVGMMQETQFTLANPHAKNVVEGKEGERLKVGSTSRRMSDVEDEEATPTSQEERPTPASTSTSPLPITQVKQAGSSSVSVAEDRKKKKTLRFFLRRQPKDEDKKKKEKPSAKRERKATKTLAIVLGVFLFCWVPFFTCNIIDAVCIKLEKPDCRMSTTAFLLTTWLGYLNSIVNPVIYTIFNPEFRKAFKKILGFKP